MRVSKGNKEGGVAADQQPKGKEPWQGGLREQEVLRTIAGSSAFAWIEAEISEEF